MNSSWNAAEPPERPPLGPADRLRLGLRAPLAVLATAGFFGLFLMLDRLDRLARAFGRPPLRALGPPALQAWGAVTLRLVGLRFRRVGQPMRRPGAVVANHASWLDIVVMQRAMPVTFVSKAEVAHWPGVGVIARGIGTLFIERRAQEARNQSAALHRRLAEGAVLCIFPEGTSTDGRRVLPFKSSLFGVFFEPDLRPTLWVQPVSIRYRPRQGLPEHFYGWWGTMDFGAHLRQVLAFSYAGTVEVVFHPPLRAAEHPDRKTLAAAAGRVVHAGFERVGPVSAAAP